MRHAASLLAADLSLEATFERLTELLAAHVDVSVVFVALAEPGARARIEYLYDHGVVRPDPGIELVKPSVALEVIATGRVAWGNTPLEWAPHGTTPIYRERPETNDTLSAIFVPMRAGGHIVGALSVQSTREGAYDEAGVDVVAAIGHFLGVAVENQRLVRDLTRSADYDTLTGLANHSYLVRALDRAIAVASRERPLAAIMFNITNFGAFNDTYGYSEGDGLLTRLARVLEGLQDDGVTIGRFGGDVFLAIVEDRTRESVEGIIGSALDRLRGVSYLAPGGPIPVAVACGYAFAPSDAVDRADLVALCDHRTRSSRKLGGMPAGEDDVEAYHLHGTFAGIETVVGSLLDRDPFTRVHLFHVNAMAKRWSEFNLDLDAESRERLLQASLLHDVGKLLVPDRILMKPAALTRIEYRAMKEHADFGRTILKPLAGYDEVAEIVGEHHERWDGAGYPRGLRGAAIRPLARAIAILDAFSAMTVDRPYHRGVPEDEAIAEIVRCSGTQFDPYYVERFVAWREGVAARPA